MLVRATLAIATVVLLVVATACGSDASPQAGVATATPTPTVPAPQEEVSASEAPTLPDQFFAAHYVDSYPNHGDVFTQAPDRVHIDFNFTLHQASAITATKDGAPVEVGNLMLDARNLSMWVGLPNYAGDGLYLVKYSACWPDQSCHDGSLRLR